MHRFSRNLVIFLVAPLMMACESVSAPQTPAPTPVPAPVPTPVPKPGPVEIGAFTPTGHDAFDAWRDDFAQRALKQGFKVSTIRSVLADARPLSVFLDTAAKVDVVDQAEFSKPIWDYVDDTVSASRLSTGKQKLLNDATLFAALEQTYGVPKEYLAAIWGMETSFGAVIGDFDAPSALASMAVEGRRQTFAEGELYAIMRLLERGDAERSWLKAGWAGAMGHTQFMPSTYYAYAVDWTGDGTKDVWKARADALASAGNYLSASGWRTGEPALREVRLPAGFDYGLADGTNRDIALWQSLGVSPVSAQSLAPDTITSAELWLPAGSTGPAFLLYPNFYVVKTYNRADAYALSVSLMAESFKGARVPQAAWPRDIDKLNIGEIKTLQQTLNKLGYNAGPVDGIAGRGTRKALQDFQKDRGLMADGFPTRRALDAVLGASKK